MYKTDKTILLLLTLFLFTGQIAGAELSIGRIIREAQKDLPVVVIDPGHGGRDPGAIGPGGLKEKDVVLEVARLLALMLESDGKIRAVLTRDCDTYVSLQDRVAIARNSNAQLMISIHADASTNPEAAGASVFVLNEKGASDNAARLLAKRENAAFTTHEGDDALDGHVAGILVSLRQNYTINRSNMLAHCIIKEFERVLSISSRGVRYAPFAVLKTYDVPAVLFELGFISNPREEVLLGRRSYQVTAAYGIANGIRQYLGFLPRPAAAASGSGDALEYRVQSGDTLWDISREFRVPLSTLQKMNSLNDQSMLQVGQRIIIPYS